jgi:DNA-binding transcriptional MocR family regulator
MLRARAERMRPGERLPSSRSLMAELGVGPITVRRAVAQLVSEGLILTRPGAGTFVAHQRRKSAIDTGWQHVSLGASPVDPLGFTLFGRGNEFAEFDLSPAYLDASIRADGRLAASMTRAARRPNVWERPPVGGVRELRSWFAREVGVDIDDVLISPGGQGALSSAIRAIVPAGSPVLFSVPTYPGALAIARSAGLVPVPVAADDKGVRVDELERALRSTGGRLVYLQPTYANPDGTVLHETRRRGVLDAVVAAGAFIIEDDFARFLAHGTQPPPPLIRDDEHGAVITVMSLTKAISPSLRIGAIIARGPVAQRVEGLRTVDDFFVSRVLQEAAVDFVSGSAWDSHRRALGRALGRRRDALAVAVARHLPGVEFSVPDGGLVLWLALARGVDADALVERASGVGVRFQSGRNYFIGEAARPYLRLSFASIDELDMDEAMRRVGSVYVGDGR